MSKGNYNDSLGEKETEKTRKGIRNPTDRPKSDQESPRRDRVIVGGSTMTDSSKKAKKTYLWMVQSVQIIGRLPKLTRVDDPTISFTKDDARRLYHPHDNAPVISLSIANFNTRWVLIDNRSSADILYYPTF